MKSGFYHRLFSTCSAAALLCAVSLPAWANPQDGVVNAGQATISSSGNTVNVNQQSDKAVIDWRQFNIAPNETTNFNQPNSGSITLNRVTDGAASQIDGHLNANGNVIIVNQNGVVFGRGAKVDVNGIVATTADTDNGKFMNGGGALTFDKAGNPNATVSNAGQITAKQAGLVGLVAPNVLNSGVISAKLGRVHLASGDTFAVDMYGDGLMKVAVSDQVKSQIVNNSGVIEAAGGTIALTAAAGKDMVNSLVSVSGELKAPSISQKNGRIIIAADGSNGTMKQGSSQVQVSGKLDVSGKNAGETGGSIAVMGDKITLKGTSSLDASGASGGGAINVGGDAHGAGTTLKNAQTTEVDAGAILNADAIQRGTGGKVVVWSDQNTDYQGAIQARGGIAGGNGGSAEVSGKKYLNFLGTADLTAAAGATGTLLLDPENVSIQTSGTPAVTCISGVCSAAADNSILTVAALQAALASANVEIDTGSTGTQTGDITFNNNVTWSSGNTLLVNAYHGITIAAGVVIKNTYTGSEVGTQLPVLLAMRADASGINNGGSITNNGTIDFSGSTGSVSLFYDRAAYGGSYTAGTQTGNAGWVAPTSASVSGQFTAYQLINTLGDLTAAIPAGLSGQYAIGENITTGGVFNGNAALSGNFTGILDGQYCALTGGVNCAITGLTQTATSATTAAGLFAISSGTLRNFTLGMDVTKDYTGSGNVQVATLAASVTGGTIANVTTTGAVNFTYSGTSPSGNFGRVGGMVADISNNAKIVNSTANDAVTFTWNTTAGGVNAFVGGLLGIAEATGASLTNDVSTGTMLIQYGAGITSSVTTEVGGLAGYLQAGTISGSHSSNNMTDGISGTTFIGGLVGLLGGNIDASYSTSTLGVTGTAVDLGGLVGVDSAGSIISNSYYQSGTISFTDVESTTSTAKYIGGLVGRNVGVISNSTSASPSAIAYLYKGSSSAAQTVQVGGLVGFNTSTVAGSVSGSSSSASVTADYDPAATGSKAINAYLGGLIGQNGNSGSATPITGADFATGNVSSSLSGGNQYLGGLIGYDNSSSSMSGLHASGDVTYPGTGESIIGGLIGDASVSAATLDQSYATGNTTVIYNGSTATLAYTGGLIGYWGGSGVTNSYSKNGTVNLTFQSSGTTVPIAYAGGLIGRTAGAAAVVSNSWSSENLNNVYQGTATVQQSLSIGGLIGAAGSSAAVSLTGDYATGNITSRYFSAAYNNGDLNVSAGGLVGTASTVTAITNSFASGDINIGTYAQTNGFGQAGGLVGYAGNAGIKISDSYATGAVAYADSTHFYAIGGLVGSGTTGVTVQRAFSTGLLTSAEQVSALVPSNFTVTDGYWDKTTSGVSTTTTAGVTGLTTTALQLALQTNFNASTWGILSGISYPYLKAIYAAPPQVLAGTTPVAGGGVTALLNGASIGTEVAGANGYFYYTLAAGTLAGAGSDVLIYETGANTGAIFLDNQSGSKTGLALNGQTLHMISSGSTVSGELADLAIAQGANTGANFFWTNSGGLAMNAGTNLWLEFGGNATIDATLSAGALTLDNTVAATISQTAAFTLTGGLKISGAGGIYNLTAAGNSTPLLAASADTVNLNNGAHNLSIDSVGGTNGVTATNFYLTDTGTVTQTQGVVATNLLLQGAGGNFLLSGTTNNIGTVAANANGIYVRDDVDGFNIGTVNGVNGITATTLVTLSDSAATGAITQSQAIVTPSLKLAGGANGSITLTNTGNAITTLAGTGTQLSFLENSGFDIGTVNGGIGLSFSNMTLSTTGTVTQSQALSTGSSGSLLLLGAGGIYQLDTVANTVGTLAANTGTAVLNNGTHNLVIGSVNGTDGVTATELDLAGTGAFTQTQALTLTGLSMLHDGTFTFTNSANNVASIAGLGSGNATINFNDGAHNLAIRTINSIAGFSNILNLYLTDTGTVTQVNSLNGVTNLLLQGAGGVYLLTNPGNNNVTNIAANTGSVNYHNGNNSLTVGTINGVSGMTTVTADTMTAGTGMITVNQAVNAGAGTLTLTADDLAINAALTGTGTLTLQPSSTTRAVCINWSSDTCASAHLDLSIAEIGHLTDGWGNIAIGMASGGLDNDVGFITFTDPVTFRGNTDIHSILSGTGDASFTATGNGPFNLYSAMTTAGGKVDLSGASYFYDNGPGVAITTGGGAVSFPAFVEEVGSDLTVTTGGGNINFLSRIDPGSAGAKSLTLNAGGGNISFSNTVDGGYNLTADAAAFTFASAWGSLTPLSAVSLTSVSSLTLPSISAASVFAQTTGATSDIVIPVGTVIAASNTGTSITLAAAENFINNGGAGALSTPGRWLVYSTDPDDTAAESLVENFHRYSCTYGVSCPALGSGNGFLYSFMPVLDVTPGTLNITYGDGVPALAGYSYALSGYLGADQAADTVTGTLQGSTGYAQFADVGSYDISHAGGSLASALGYQFNYVANPAALVVGAKALTASLTGIVSRDYDGTLAATLASGNYSLSGVVNGDDVSVAGSTAAAYDTVNAGTGKTVSASGLTLGGTKSSNYTLSANTASGAVGVILAKSLSVTALDASKTVGQADPALSYSQSGLIGGDSITGTLARAGGESVGDYAILQGTLDAGSNYTISFTPGDFSIVAAGQVSGPEVPATVVRVSQTPQINTVTMADGTTSSDTVAVSTSDDDAPSVSGGGKHGGHHHDDDRDNGEARPLYKDFPFLKIDPALARLLDMPSRTSLSW